MILQAAIQETIDSVCPNFGMSFGKVDDKSTWSIRYKPEATPDQIIQAQEIIKNFVWDDAAKKKSDDNEKMQNHKDNLAMKGLYMIYKNTNPDVSFLQFIEYLEKANLNT